LRGEFDEIVAGEDREIYESRVEELVRLGAEEEFARNLITLRFLDQLLEILRVGRETGSDPIEAARAFYQVSDTLQVPWIRRMIFQVAGDDRWEQRAAQALVTDLTRGHHHLAATVMKEWRGAGDVTGATRRILRAQSRELKRLLDLLEELRAEEEINFSGLAVAVREVSALSEKVNGEPP